VKLLHTSLPEFKLKMKQAAVTQSPNKKLSIVGMENLKAAKMQSLRTGRIELAVDEIARQREICCIEVIVRPRVPETMHTVVIKGYDKDKNPKQAIIESLNVIHPTEDIDLEGLEEQNIIDRRPKLNEH